ncbi:MAG: putative membrane protein [Phormidesmis priestleyi Ana]|uniref:Putative membrane protein n=1 Tax=Phormidesmis priestleyi Ana TaxID=1666911 RepID=A0A0N8KNQ9_9CYAN|nr:MAG: putative membrane protein [Phormidesmis priestleyi Ana]
MKDNRTEDKRSQPPIKKQKKPQAHAQSYAQSHAQSHTQSSFKSFFKSSVKPLFKFPFKLKEAALKEHPKSHIPEPHTKAHIKAHTTEAYKTEAGPKIKRPRTARRHSLLSRLRYYLPQAIHRPIIQAARQIGKNSGDWQWMADNPMPLKGLNRSLWRNAEPTLNYHIMLFLSGVISTLGLLSGSTAAIIGAMIVAPLMGPITAMAFAITMGNRRLLKRSLLSVVSGILLTVGTAYLISRLVGLSSLSSEVLLRTQPTLIDLAIGLAAGAAGAFAKTRKDIADALPGVAIAVALVPPLSVMGIGLAFASREVLVGSTLLFITNLAGIVLAGGLVFIWQDYGSLKRAKRGLSLSIVVLCFLGVPLGLSLRDLIIEERARSFVSSLLRDQTLTFGNTNIRRLRVDSSGEVLEVDLEVAAPTDSISDRQIDLVHDFLEERLDRPIRLNVSVFPMQEFSSRESDLPSAPRPSGSR